MATKITTFNERFPGLQDDASFDTLNSAAEDMQELAAKLGEEAFHFVSGAIFVAERIAPWSARFAALQSVYEHQGLDTVEQA